MLLEYYTIRLKDAEPGKGLLHTTQHYDEIHSSIKHFKEKHPGQEVVAYKHEIKKGPMGATFKRKAMFGKSKPVTEAVDFMTRFHAKMKKQADQYDQMDPEWKHVVAHWTKKTGKAPSGDAQELQARESYNKTKRKTVKEESLDEARMPLVDHPYHKKTDAELKYIIKDAGQAAKAQKGMSSEGKYLDQVNDASTILHYRKTKGLQEATRSFKTLMRSIEDKKSIKNLKVPSPSDRNPDGSMKPKEEPKKLSESNTAYHRVSVTVSDPNHTMVSKRKDKIQKFIRVKGDESTAVDKAKAHYKKKGLKVHSAEYVEGYDKFLDDKSMKEDISESVYDTKSHAQQIHKKVMNVNNTDRIDTANEIKRAYEKGLGSKSYMFNTQIKTVPGYKNVDHANNSANPSFEKIHSGILAAFNAGRTAKPKKVDESTSKFTHMVHAQGNLDNPMLYKRLKHCDGDYHQESDKGSWFKFTNKSDAKLFSTSMKHYAKDIYTGDVYHMNSNRVDESSTDDSFTETKHTHESGGDKYEVRGEKYPNLRRPRHAIFKNGVYHSMAGTMMDAKARVNHIASTK